MVFKELLFYIKKFKTISALTYLAVVSLLLILGTSFSFIYQLKYELNNIGQIYKGKTIFHIIDGYYDGEAFQHFMEDENSLTSLKNFYEGLNQSEKFSYLAMDDQHVLIEEGVLDSKTIQKADLKGQGRRIKIEGKEYIPQQAFQMNEQSFDYFDIEVSSGNGWTLRDFEDRGVPMPILLGNSYCDSYKQGDTIPINFHTQNINAEVKGCIKPNEKVFYRGETEFYLDNYILMPFRTYGNPSNPEEEFFQKVSYLSMINGYLITDNNTFAIKNMMDYITMFSERSGIDYTFIGMNPHFKKYDGLMKTMEENKTLATFTLFLTFCINSFMLVIILVLQQNRRLNYYAVHFINGAGKKDVLFQFIIQIGLIMMLSLITCILTLEIIFKIGNIYIYFILFVITLILILVSSLFPIFNLIKRPIADYLKYDEGSGI